MVRAAARVRWHAAVLALAARGAVGGGLDLKGIGKAIKDVSKDPSKVKDAVEHVAEDPGKLIGEASKAAQGASDLAQEASGALPAISISTGDGAAAAAPAPEQQAPPPDPANESVKEDQAGKIKDAVKATVKDSSLGSLLSGKKIGDAIKGVTGEKVVDAITKADPSKIEDAARGVAEEGQKIAEAAKDASVKDIASAVTSEVGGSDSVVDRAKSALDLTGVTDPDSALDKAKQVIGKAKEAKDVSLGDLADKAKSASVADLKDAAAGAKSPKELLDNLGKKKVVEPVGDDGGEDQVHEDGGSSGLAVIFLILLAVGGYVLFTRLTQPRQVGRPMLSDDYGAEGVAMTTGHWMGASARDMINTTGGNTAEFNRF